MNDAVKDSQVGLDLFTQVCLYQPISCKANKSRA